MVPVPMARSWVALSAVVANRIDGKAEKQFSRRTVCGLCADELIGQRSAARKAGLPKVLLVAVGSLAQWAYTFPCCSK